MLDLVVGAEEEKISKNDRMEQYCQQTWAEGVLGKDGGNVGGAEMGRFGNTPGGEEAQTKRHCCLFGWSDMWEWQFGHRYLLEDYNSCKSLEES